MGSCMSRLHAQPVLTSTVIEQAVAAVLSTDPNHVLRDADLAEQVERVKLTALPLNLEELSRLWSMFVQVPYVLSVAYQASVVLIEEPVEAPAPALPVRERRIFIEPFRRIRLERVQPTTGQGDPIHGDSIVRILGTGLASARLIVNVDGEIVSATVISPGEITLDLSALSDLRAGILPLYVAHGVSELAPQLRFESNVLALTVAPRVQSVAFTPADAETPASVDLELFTALEGEYTVIAESLGDTAEQNVEVGPVIVTPPTPPVGPGDLTVGEIDGIGPVFTGQLTASGVRLVREFVALPPERIAEILSISVERARNLLVNARRLLEE